jgi:hypothetical protein
LGVAAAQVATKPAQSFHAELAGVVRIVGSGGLSVANAAERLGAHKPLPTGRAVEEVADLIARLVDEPNAARHRLLPLLPALVDVELFEGPDVLARGVEAFAQEAFADPEDLDPPDLVDIVLKELLPALGIKQGSLQLPPCLAGVP